MQQEEAPKTEAKGKIDELLSSINQMRIDKFKVNFAMSSKSKCFRSCSVHISFFSYPIFCSQFCASQKACGSLTNLLKIRGPEGAQPEDVPAGGSEGNGSDVDAGLVEEKLG